VAVPAMWVVVSAPGMCVSAPEMCCLGHNVVSLWGRTYSVYLNKVKSRTDLWTTKRIHLHIFENECHTLLFQSNFNGKKWTQIIGNG
jgi:hypothetical protein